jgi:class 3 adenylate cyclase
MFLDIRNFTANARTRQPAEVVEFLNAAFAFMI